VHDVTDETPKKRKAATPKPENDFDENERPTVNPPFDVEAFARAATGQSENSVPPPLEGATRRPPPPAALPSFDEDDDERITDRITLTREVELERARAQSAVAKAPPRTITLSALSIANSRAPSSPHVEAQRGPVRNLSPSSIEAAVLGAISAAPEITERTIDDPLAEMRERFSLGDYSGALEMSELILAEEADNLDASVCAENCRTVLENMYAARLGPSDRVPVVVVARTQMRWLSMDHRAGFIVSLIDGSSTIDMVLDMSGMPKLDAYRILNDLVEQKIVSFR
jgi:hypothetical protein